MEAQHLDRFSIWGVIQSGWQLTKEHLPFLLGYQVILGALLLLLQLVDLGLVVHGILWLLVLLAKIGFIKSLLLITQKIRPQLDQLYTNWQLLPSYIVAAFLFGMAFLFGLLFFIIPGLYIWARYGLFSFFLVDLGTGPIQALKFASQASEGLRWKLFLLFLAVAGLNILGFLAFGVGILISAPVGLLAIATVYRQLRSRIYPMDLPSA